MWYLLSCYVQLDFRLSLKSTKSISAPCFWCCAGFIDAKICSNILDRGPYYSAIHFLVTHLAWKLAALLRRFIWHNSSEIFPCGDVSSKLSTLAEAMMLLLVFRWTSTHVSAAWCSNRYPPVKVVPCGYLTEGNHSIFPCETHPVYYDKHIVVSGIKQTIKRDVKSYGFP